MHRIEATAPDVHKFVSRRVPNAADAADISQQALLLACSKLSTFRGDNVRAWIYGIAHHLIIDHYRARNRFQFVTVGPETDAETELALRTSCDAVQTAYESRQRLNAWMECCTDGLPLECQVAVLLADAYDYTDKDSAAMLRMSVPSFKLLLHDARHRLKHITPPHGAGVPPAAPTVHRAKVLCHVEPAVLRALQVWLIDGLVRATFALLLIIPTLY